MLANSTRIPNKNSWFMLRWGSCCLPFPWWFYCLRAWRETVLNKRFSHLQKYIYCSHYYVGERETRHSSSPTASSVHYPNYYFFSCTRPLYTCFYDLVAVNKLIQTDSVTCFHLLAGVGSWYSSAAFLGEDHTPPSHLLFCHISNEYKWRSNRRGYPNDFPQ